MLGITGRRASLVHDQYRRVRAPVAERRCALGGRALKGISGQCGVRSGAAGIEEDASRAASVDAGLAAAPGLAIVDGSPAHRDRDEDRPECDAPEGVARCRAAWARLIGRQTRVVHGDLNPGEQHALPRSAQEGGVILVHSTIEAPTCTGPVASTPSLTGRPELGQPRWCRHVNHHAELPMSVRRRTRHLRSSRQSAAGESGWARSGSLPPLA